jgi:hypothetical protein
LNSTVFGQIRKSVVFIQQNFDKRDSLISNKAQKVSRVEGPRYFHSVTRIIKEHYPHLGTKKRNFL